MYAKVIVEIGVKNVDKMFTYIIPRELQIKIKIGVRVTVPFGYQILEGFVRVATPCPASTLYTYYILLLLNYKLF